MKSKRSAKDLTIKSLHTLLVLSMFWMTGAQGQTAPDSPDVDTLRKAARSAQFTDKKPAEAIELWSRLLQHKPDDNQALRLRGSAYAETGQYELAERDALRATELDPRNSNAWNSVCWGRILANRPLEARPACEKSVALDANNMSATVNLGHTWLLVGNTTTAQGWYSKALPLIDREDDLKEGPLDDFGIFIERGWQPEASRQARNWFADKGQAWLARKAPADSLLKQAQAAEKAGDNAMAVTLYKERLPLLEGLYGEENLRVILAVDKLGDLLAAAGRHAEALPLYQRVLAWREKRPGEESKLVVTLNDVARTLKYLAYYHQAEPLDVRALAISEKFNGPEHPTTGIRLNNLAGLYESMGQYARAEPLYIRALAISEKAEGPEHPSTSRNLNNLAGLYVSMGQYARAEPLYVRALAISEKAEGPEHPSTGTSLNNLAALYYAMGQYARAELLLVRALAISEKAKGPEHPSTGTSLNNLAMLHRSMGQYARAEPLFIRALAISEKAEGPEHPSTGIRLNNLALLYQSMGQHARAESLHVRALAISEKAEGTDHPTTGIRLNNLAELYRAQGQYAHAEPFYLRALAISEKAEGTEHPSTGRNLNNLALLYESMGESARAEPLFLRTWRIASKAGNPELSWKVQGNLRRLYTDTQPSLAIWYGKQAVNTLQQVRAGNTALDKATQKSFLEKNETTYKSLADLLFAQGRLMEGQQVLAMLKEAEYFDFVERSSAVDPRKTQSGFTEQERPWSERYEQISTQLAGLSKEYDALQKKDEASLSADEKARLAKLDADLTVARQAYDAFMVDLKREFTQGSAARKKDDRIEEYGAKNLASLTALQGTLETLGHGAVTLHYLMTEKRLWILLTTPTVQLKREAAISEADLNRQIGQYREAIARRDPKIRELGKALYDILIAPVADDLKQAEARTLMLSLDGSLRYLPMAALFDGEQFLAQRYRLALFTEAAKDKLSTPPKAQWRFAGFGLTEKVENFDALPSVKGELEGMVTPGFSGEIKFDKDFTASSFKSALARRPPVVHLASHFVFKSGTEADSYLLLGDGTPLSLKAIKEGNFRFTDVDLVTLSACETAVGGGKDANGREVEGFGALAQNQGAKGVIATLWPVADQSTGQFMQLFYGFRQNTPGMTKAEAMQKAQLAFIEGKVGPALAEVSRGAKRGDGAKVSAAVNTTNHPYFWAPFILMGNWL